MNIQRISREHELDLIRLGDDHMRSMGVRRIKHLCMGRFGQLLQIPVVSIMYGTVLLHEPAIYSKVRDTAMKLRSIVPVFNVWEVARCEQRANDAWPHLLNLWL